MPPVRPALEEVRIAVAAAGELGDEPRGTLRLHLTTGAESYLTGPLLAGFLTAHAQMRLDLAVSEAPLDIVAEGFDAGVRLGEVIDRDMIAVPVSGGGHPARRRRVAGVLRSSSEARAPARPRRARVHRVAPHAGRTALSMGVHRERPQLLGRRGSARAQHRPGNQHPPRTRRRGCDDGSRRPDSRRDRERRTCARAEGVLAPLPRVLPVLSAAAPGVARVARLCRLPASRAISPLIALHVTVQR